MWAQRPRLRATGSSPRVRGTHQAHVADVEANRFIPAGAGNAGWHSGCWSSSAVHPRGCGERMRGRPVTSSSCGSSPRVRGTRKSCRTAAARNRFIPAGAGNAQRGRVVEDLAAVHPRGCGERGRPLSVEASSSGSSPRVRGTHFPHVRYADSTRFIPAGAGNAPLKSVLS